MKQTETKNQIGLTKTLIAVVLLASILIFFPMKKFYGINSSADTKSVEKVKNITDKNFKQEIKSGIVLVDFWAPWCVPCKRMAPILNDVAGEMGRNVKICKLNIDENKQFADTYSIESIPTMILFKNGKEIKRIIGMQSKESLISKIKKQK